MIIPLKFWKELLIAPHAEFVKDIDLLPNNEQDIADSQQTPIQKFIQSNARECEQDSQDELSHNIHK